MVIDGSIAGAWIRSRLGGEVGSVTDLVPRGFEAYARVFHPASDAKGNPVKWADVAKKCGTIPHREMQWHAILGFADPDELRGSYSPNDPNGPEWAGSDPPTGAMDIATLDALCKILAAHTADPSRCFFGLCTIQSWLDSFSTDDLQPLLKLPYERDHIVLSGPLSAVDQIAYDRFRQGSPIPYRETPNLIWPADHAWLVASEVDFDSTLVGGDTKLVNAIVESPELETWQVEMADSFTADADKVNVVTRG